jgi:putative protease
VSYRDFCTGFYLNDPDSLMPYYENDRRKNQQSFFGKVTAIDAKNRVLVDIRNKICIGESIEILKPEGPPLKSTVLKIHSAQGESLDVAQPGMRVSLKISVKCQPNDLIRRSEN